VPTWVTYIDRNSQYGAVQSGVTTVSACRAACVADPRCVGVDWNPAGPPYCYAHRDRLNGPFRTVGITQHVLVDRCTTGMASATRRHPLSRTDFFINVTENSVARSSNQ